MSIVIPVNTSTRWSPSASLLHLTEDKAWLLLAEFPVFLVEDTDELTCGLGTNSVATLGQFSEGHALACCLADCA